MTLNDIIVSALAQLDRGHDAQTLDTWREKLTRFANEAVLDLSAAYCPRRTEELTLDGKLLRTERLSRPCIRVYGVKRLGRFTKRAIPACFACRGQRPAAPFR